ncbi:MAG: response regulator transcription factor [SAR324 cluster bacterium]|nr:response regulator transcription factor [SAR324 cluster bacterium]
MIKILILDDDKDLGELLQDYLKGFGFEVVVCHHPKEAFAIIESEKPDLMTLDVMMPEQDGFSFLKELRQKSALPVIMLTARGDLTDRVVGLEIGADDYLPKPFEPRELVARIQSILRRASSEAERPKGGVVKFAELSVDLSKHEAHLSGTLLELTSTEFELLKLFVNNPGKVLSRDEILNQVSGIEWDSFNRSIDVLVSRLRQKLNDEPKHPRFLKTIWGSGYLFLGIEE